MLSCNASADTSAFSPFPSVLRAAMSQREMSQRLACAATEVHHNPPGGSLAADVSRHVVWLFAEYMGRGPTKARTTIRDDVIVCVTQDTYMPRYASHASMTASTSTPAWSAIWFMLDAAPVHVERGRIAGDADRPPTTHRACITGIRLVALRLGQGPWWRA